MLTVATGATKGKRRASNTKKSTTVTCLAHAHIDTQDTHTSHTITTRNDIKLHPLAADSNSKCSCQFKKSLIDMCVKCIVCSHLVNKRRH